MKQFPIAKPTVLIFKETLLPISETFIDAQTRHLSNFVPRYVGLGRVTPSLAIPEDSIVLTRGESMRDELRQKLYRRFGVAPQFHRRAAAAGATLIHAHFASGGRSALPLARRLRIPLIVTLHGSDVTTQIDFRRRYHELWEEASVFVCVSDFIKRRAVAEGFPEDKLRVHYTGIDRTTFQPENAGQRQNVVLFVGRLVEKKGCEFLLQAMASLKTSHPDVKTVILGDGPLRTSLEDLAVKLEIPCQFLGAKPAPVVRQWMSTARVFCAPSVTAANGDSEGLGMVFAEAQAVGTPVVSSLHGGIPEIVLDGMTGLLAPEGDSAALAKHIRRFLEDQTFWQTCAHQGVGWIREQFDVKSQIHELEDIYNDVCESDAGLEEGILVGDVSRAKLATRSARTLASRTPMPHFSVIIPTIGRTEELDKMLRSLADQRPADFEVIVVDQNEDDRVDRLLSTLAPEVTALHVRRKQKGASGARNAGLAMSSGEIVSFPDDDCWYPAALLANVGEWFHNNPRYDILAVGAKDEHDIPSGNRWIQSQCDIRPFNALRTTFCNSLFLRRGALPASIQFDESLDLGEETDFILRLMKAGLRGRFDRTFHVGHPRRDMLSGSISRSRAHRYGEGMGRLVRRHSLASLWLGLLAYDVLRATAVFLKAGPADARFCAAHAQGLFHGFVSDAPGKTDL